MLKKTLALSLTSLFCLPALAQSGIQLYGSVDASFQYGKEMGNKTAGIDGGGIGDSFLGLRGEEALGAGLEAVFVLEQGSTSMSANPAASTKPTATPTPAAISSRSKPMSDLRAPLVRSPWGVNTHRVICLSSTTHCPIWR
ncbi:porin [Tepidiphilus sp. B18-69]|uniref:Porin n=1 Tax=Tepidiphilus baoligensis TaxID=2698687 RepID=A0ABX1QQ19_9PROT|nr:porin [Tepidiphilus baoligensis]